VIDLHSHVLPGLDDGARNLDEALAICRAAAEDGVTVLAATPHVRDDFPTSPEAMETALAQVQEAAGELIQVVSGGEVAISELGRPVEELRGFGLGGSRWLLVETPYFSWPADFPARIEQLQAAGFRVLLAHPERNPAVQEKPELVAGVVDAGALVQVTAASLDGRIGHDAHDTARRLLRLELVHVLASDAHAAWLRAAGISAAARALEDDALATWLTVDVPQAILADADVPERPGRRRRRWL
jgi:protein-tyrosine phosphatase